MQQFSIRMSSSPAAATIVTLASTIAVIVAPFYMPSSAATTAATASAAAVVAAAAAAASAADRIRPTGSTDQQHNGPYKLRPRLGTEVTQICTPTKLRKHVPKNMPTDVPKKSAMRKTSTCIKQFAVF